jgi:hypothetical protein
MSKSSLHLALQFSIHLITWNDPCERTPLNPECESPQSESTHGLVRSRLPVSWLRIQAEYLEPRTLASRFCMV